MVRRISICVALVLNLASSVAAQQAVFVVRHAERADAGMTATTDPDLSTAGLARAESLAVALKDAGVTTIFATEFKRTQQTAAPLAKALGLTVTTVSSKDLAGLVQKVKAASGNVLVVGHSNTVPDVIKALGVDTSLKIGDPEYDNLFVVLGGEKPSMIRLHYR